MNFLCKFHTYFWDDKAYLFTLYEMSHFVYKILNYEFKMCFHVILDSPLRMVLDIPSGSHPHFSIPCLLCKSLNEIVGAIQPQFSRLAEISYAANILAEKDVS